MSKYISQTGEIFAGVYVIYKGAIYETGNRKFPMVELFKNGKFIKTVNQEDLIIIKTKNL